MYGYWVKKKKQTKQKNCGAWIRFKWNKSIHALVGGGSIWICWSGDKCLFMSPYTYLVLQSNRTPHCRMMSWKISRSSFSAVATRLFSFFCQSNVFYSPIKQPEIRISALIGDGSTLKNPICFSSIHETHEAEKLPALLTRIRL